MSVPSTTAAATPGAAAGGLDTQALNADGTTWTINREHEWVPPPAAADKQKDLFQSRQQKELFDKVTDLNKENRKNKLPGPAEWD